jgi:hypothetical protein
MLLASDVQAGVVVDREGRLRGVVTADSIGEQMRDGLPRRTRAPAAREAAVR